MAKGKKKKKKPTKKETGDVLLDDALKSTKDAPDISLASSLRSSKAASLDEAPESAQETQSDLQGLLKGVSERSFYQREIIEEEKIDPQLSHEKKTQVVEEYMMEDVPITERAETKTRVPAKKKPTTEPTPAQPVESIYGKLQLFLEGLMDGYNQRYHQWENSISNILAILRKMRKYTKKNTEDLTFSITSIFSKIRLNLDQFKTKRNEIEKLSGVDIGAMSGEFKKVLGLLELQIKEYQLKKITDEFIHKKQLFSQ